VKAPPKYNLLVPYTVKPQRTAPLKPVPEKLTAPGVALGVGVFVCVLVGVFVFVGV
jgi:hypothetical protein